MAAVTFYPYLSAYVALPPLISPTSNDSDCPERRSLPVYTVSLHADHMVSRHLHLIHLSHLLFMAWLLIVAREENRKVGEFFDGGQHSLPMLRISLLVTLHEPLSSYALQVVRHRQPDAIREPVL